MSARCAYCDASLRPNSMFCLECGQLVQGAEPPVPQGIRSTPAAAPRPGPVAAAAPAPSSQPMSPVPLPAMWQAPGVPSAAPAPVATPQSTSSASRPARRTTAPTVTLTFSTGERAVVSGSAVIGRQPQSTAQNSGSQAIEIHDTTRSVSRVHLLVAVDLDGVSVTDPGSGNGSSVERNGVKTPLREGKPAAVESGDRIWLGDVAADVLVV